MVCQFDHDQPLGEQARALVDDLDLSAELLQTTALRESTPSLEVIAATLLAEIHVGPDTFHRFRGYGWWEAAFCLVLKLRRESTFKRCGTKPSDCAEPGHR